MAKEGFDWPWCEHALTVGYRGSLTEIIQIIGRATRDSPNKTHAQFTNLIAQPDAERRRGQGRGQQHAEGDHRVAADGAGDRAELQVQDQGAPRTRRLRRSASSRSAASRSPRPSECRHIVEADLNDLKAQILQDQTMLKAMPGNIDPEVMNKVLIPKIIRELATRTSARRRSRRSASTSSPTRSSRTARSRRSATSGSS